MKQKKLSKSYSAPALDKGLDILELLSSSDNGLTQAEIATRLNKSVNEIYRMLSTLRHREYITFDEETDVYNLSYKILNMTAKFEPVKTLMARSIPLMKEIAIKTNQSIHLAIYTRGKILIIAQEVNIKAKKGNIADLLLQSSFLKSFSGSFISDVAFNMSSAGVAQKAFGIAQSSLGGLV